MLLLIQHSWPSLLPERTSGLFSAWCLLRPPGPFQQSCSMTSQPVTSLCHCNLYCFVFFPGCSTSHLSLMNFIMFLSAHSSRLRSFGWQPALDCIHDSHYLVSSANLMRVPTIAFSRSLTKMLNKTGLIADSCSAPFVNGLQVEYNPYLLPSELHHATANFNLPNCPLT